MRTLIAIAVLVACSASWGEEESVELLCTFNDGTESIRSYPLVSHESREVESNSDDTAIHLCNEEAEVSSSLISLTRTCNLLTGTRVVERISINRRSGVYTSNIRAGRCEKASEVQNKF